MKKAVLVLLFACTVAVAWGQSIPPFSLVLNPGTTLPLGGSRDFYTMGAAVNLAGNYTLPFAPLFYVSGQLEYDILPLATERSLSIFYAGIAAGVQYAVIPRLRVAAGGGGGFYLGIYGGETGPGAYVSAGAQATYQLSPTLSLGLGAAYQNCLARPYSLFQGISVNLVTSFHLGGATRKPLLEVPRVEIQPIFPVLYKYYDDHPVGSVTLVNREKGAVEDVVVSFYISQYMEKPKICTVLTGLRAGEEVEVNLFALLNERILETTEATKVSAELTVSYDYLDAEWVKQETHTVRVFDRNALTWDDDRKAAAFVSAKDPSVLKFSKSIAGVVRSAGGTAVSKDFRVGLGLFQGLAEHGVSYVVDPKTPYAEFSTNALALDYLQFPRHTLEYRGGDCDDLSILYNALAESVGIETAFITVPGHIYSAFSLGMEPALAQKTFRSSEGLIFQDGKTWVPVEVTLLDQGFLKAWQAGARQWRDHLGSDQARLHPVHEAWRVYEPVGIVGPDPGIDFPPEGRLAASYAAELARFVEQEIAPEVARLQTQIQKLGDSRAMNSLGVLYARYGLLDKAREQFQRVLRREAYVPALVNLGNIYLLEGDAAGAWEHFERAEARQPGNATVLLSMARIRYEQGDYAAAARYHDRLSDVNLQLAGRHGYLAAVKDTGTRAAATDMEGLVSWEEED